MVVHHGTNDPEGTVTLQMTETAVNPPSEVSEVVAGNRDSADNGGIRWVSEVDAATVSVADSTEGTRA